MEKSSWSSKLLVIILVLILSPLDNFVVARDVCRNYGNDVCLCHQNPTCLFSQQTDNCVRMSEACEDFQFPENNCIQNGQFYATNGVICEYHDDDDSVCEGEEISFSRREPTYFKDVSSSTSEEFGEEVKSQKQNDIAVKTRSDPVLDDELCIGYQIPAKIAGHYQMTLEKTSIAPGAALNIMMNGIIVLHEIDEARLSIGQRFHINYVVMFEIGQLLLTMNEDTLLEIEDRKIDLKICHGMCSANRVQKPLDSIFLRLVKVMKFMPLAKLSRHQRDLTDQVKLNVGLDTADGSSTTPKPTKKSKGGSDEESSSDKKKKTTTTATTASSKSTTATTPITTSTPKPTTTLTTTTTTTEDPTMPIGGRSMKL